MSKPMYVIESKDSVADDLLRVYNLLIKYNLCEKNLDQLYLAEGECRRNSNEEIWAYSITSLEFYIDKLPHVIPVDIKNLGARLSVDVEGYYYADDIVTNPLRAINQFDIEIFGVNDKGAPLISSWHLDKHEIDVHDGDGKLFHPEYHITYGGHIMENSGYDFGASIILRSPRLLHPPMDAILGVDFILRNYVYKEWTEELFSESEYQLAILNSKRRLWKSYYLALASYWHNFGEYNLDKEFSRIIVSH